jgi:hypothetical protein
MNSDEGTLFFNLFLDSGISPFAHYISFLWRMALRHIKFAGVNVRVPSHPILRVFLGIVLIIGGLLGFLPILGFWMLPLGLVVLSVDFAFIRRFRRRASVRFGRWMLRHWPSIARRIGFGT